MLAKELIRCEPPRTFKNVNIHTRKKHNLEKFSLTVDLTNSHFSKWYNNSLLRCGHFIATENTFFSPSNCSIPSVSNAAFQRKTTTTETEKMNKKREKNQVAVCRAFFFERGSNQELKRKRRKQQQRTAAEAKHRSNL